jgi:exonuclease SbcC
VAADRWTRAAAARATLADLDERGGELDALQTRVEAAERARPCEPLVAAHRDAQRQSARAARAAASTLRGLQEALDTAPTRLVGLLDGLMDPADGLPPAAAVSALRDDVRAFAVRLEQAAGRHRDLVAAQTAAAERRQAAEVARDAAAQCRAEAAAAHTEAAAVREEREAAVRAAEGVAARQADVARLQACCDAAAALPGRQAEHDAAAKALSAATQGLNDALDAQRRVLERRIDGMAAELASALVAGEPCGVCGATEHPTPAVATAPAVAPGEIDDAADAVRAARAAVDAAADAQRSAAEALTALRTNAGAAADEPQSVQEQLATVRAGLDAARRSADALPVLDERVAGLEATHAAALAAAGDHDAAAAAANAEADRCTTVEQGLQSDVAAAVGVAGDPADAAAATAVIVRLVDSLDTDVAEAERTAAAADSAAEALQAAVAAAGFSCADEAAQAAVPAAELAALREALQQADRQRSRAQDALAEIGEVGDAAPDLAAARDAAATADEELSAAQQRAALVRQAAGDIARLALRVDEVAGQHRAAAEEAVRLRRLADICAGTGTSGRISLERYVLAAFLEEIAEAASVRLLAMTDGRFSVRHSDERAKHGAASGLSITVLDAYTGTERDPGSLSGGETFQASLCLALAVADVVQRHAGGVHLDTLFVDEGFGALDAESLEQAIAELDALQEGGRLVGVISHVPALRERITTGIAVTKTATGSDAAVVTPASV